MKRFEESKQPASKHTSPFKHLGKFSMVAASFLSTASLPASASEQPHTSLTTTILNNLETDFTQVALGAGTLKSKNALGRTAVINVDGTNSYKPTGYLFREIKGSHDKPYELSVSVYGGKLTAAGQPTKSGTKRYYNFTVSSEGITKQGDNIAGVTTLAPEISYSAHDCLDHPVITLEAEEQATAIFVDARLHRHAVSEPAPLNERLY